MKIDILKQAILNETEGYEFYRLYASKATAKPAKEAFEQIAREELRHIEYLKALGRGESLDLSAEDDAASPEVFQFEPNAMPEELSMAISAMRIAMKLEADAMDFYRKAAEESEHAEAKNLYAKLVDWEKEHYEWFRREYESLKEIWWAANQYEPFG